jgi:hypothetical protein
LNYGDVSVQTAGESEHFLFRQIADPSGIKDLIMKLSREATEDTLREVADELSHKA